MKKIIKKVILLTTVLIIVFSIQTFAATGQQVVDCAMKFLNYPYGWGGDGRLDGCNGYDNGDKRAGNHTKDGVTYRRCFDCAGLVWHVLKECKVSANPSSKPLAKQYSYIGTNVKNNASLQKGDILVFRNGEHVGIYIGNNQYIHACGDSTRTHWYDKNYGYVQIDNLSNDTITARRRVTSSFDSSITPKAKEYTIPKNITIVFNITPNIYSSIYMPSEVDMAFGVTISTMQNYKIEKVNLYNSTTNKTYTSSNGTFSKWQIQGAMNKNREIAIAVYTKEGYMKRNVYKVPKNIQYTNPLNYTQVYVNGKEYVLTENTVIEENGIIPYIELYNENKLITKVEILKDNKYKNIEITEKGANRVSIIPKEVINGETINYFDENNEIKLKITYEDEQVNEYTIKIINNLEIKEGITAVLENKEYEATKENPLKEGVYLTTLQLKNNIDKKVVKWEAFNCKDNKYEVIYNTEITGEYKDIVDFYLKEIHYEKVDENMYCIKVKAVYEDGTEIEKEIYQYMIKILVPWNEENVVTRAKLEMRWNGNEDEEYDIRLVRLISETEKEVVIGEGDKAKKYKGNSFIIEGNTLLIPDSRYRLAVKSADGIYYDIVEFITTY